MRCEIPYLKVSQRLSLVPFGPPDKVDVQPDGEVTNSCGANGVSAQYLPATATIDAVDDPGSLRRSAAESKLPSASSLYGCLASTADVEQ